MAIEDVRFPTILILLSLNGATSDISNEGFTKHIVGQMFGFTKPIEEIIVLVQDDKKVLSVPWPDGLTLDKAMYKWAYETTQQLRLGDTRPWENSK